MYGIYKVDGFRKTLLQSYGQFDDVDTAVKALQAYPGVVAWDRDDEFDAADAFLQDGRVVAIERVRS